MSSVARRTRGRLEAELLANYHEMKAKEKKAKENKEKEEKEKEKIVAMEEGGVIRDDVESDSLEIVGEGSFTGPTKKESSNGFSSTRSKRSQSEENGFKADEDVLIADSSKSAGSKRGRSDKKQKSGKKKSEFGARKEVINWSSFDSDSAEEVRRKASRYEENGRDDIHSDRTNKNQESGKGGKAEFGARKKVISSSESDPVEEVSKKASGSDDDVMLVGERLNPCPQTRPRKNWNRLIRSERARIDGNGTVEEGDQVSVHYKSSESSGSELSSSEEDLDDTDYSAESISSDTDSGTDSGNGGKGIKEKDDYSAESLSSDTESGSDSCNAAERKMEDDDIMRVFQKGSQGAFREGQGSPMEMDDFLPVDVLYEKREKDSEKKRFGSRWSKRVHSRSDSKPKKNKHIDSSDEDGGGSGSDRVANKSEKLRNKKVGKKKLSKKKKSAADIKNAINLLMAKTLLEDGASGDCGGPSFDEVPMQTELPLKFRFEDEDPAPPPEPWEIEMEELFIEMDMCLTSTYSANATTSSSKNEVTEETLSAKSPMERCRLGHHIEVLEEPIGIICKCCQLVLTEMKYIFPDLMMPSPKKHNSYYFGRDDMSEYYNNDIPLGDSIDENYISSIQTEGSVLDLIPSKTRKSMYRHQLDGFVFLWKNVVGETNIEKLKELPSKQGSGCIISHAPGTGKTCLSIVFIMTLMRAFPYPECRPVIVAPKSMLLTWQHEFEKWDFGFPFHNLNSNDLSGKEIEVLGLDKMVSRQSGMDSTVSRKLKLCSWTRQKSILGVSYSLFEKIVKKSLSEKQFLLEKPGLIVLDEGHTPRNRNSCMWKALKEVKTRKRIILSGTPFQNSFQELQTTLHLVNPDLSSNSDLNWKNLKSDAIDKGNDNSIAKLKAMIDPLVHVHKGTILQERLPGLKDMLVILRPTIQQNHAFKAISDAPNQFEKVHLVSLASVHPSLARKKEFLKLKPGLEFLDDTNSDAGVKTKFVIQLLKLCDALGEKVLIFSEFIGPLKFLKKKFKDELSWIEGKEVLYMDGAQEAKMRQASISSLNDPKSEVKVLLASTKACSEGIHLVGASRVVLLDVVWNPSVERQAISRAFRLGQTKVVYVYHLILMGTLEMEKYKMQTRKHRLAELVFSSRDMESKKTNISAAVAEDKLLELMMDDKIYKDMFEEIVHV